MACLLNQPYCGLKQGEGACGKCGLKPEGLPKDAAARELALLRAEALYWRQHAQALEVYLIGQASMLPAEQTQRREAVLGVLQDLETQKEAAVATLESLQLQRRQADESLQAMLTQQDALAHALKGMEARKAVVAKALEALDEQQLKAAAIVQGLEARKLEAGAELASLSAQHDATAESLQALAAQHEAESQALLELSEQKVAEARALLDLTARKEAALRSLHETNVKRAAVAAKEAPAARAPAVAVKPAAPGAPAASPAPAAPAPAPVPPVAAAKPAPVEPAKASPAPAAAAAAKVAASSPAQPAAKAGAVKASGKLDAFCDFSGAPEMVQLPPGEFMMGAAAEDSHGRATERPQHAVKIDYTLAVGRFPVTFEQWEACVSAGGSRHKPASRGGRGTHPVIHISWDDAQEYIAWLNKKAGLAQDAPERYRLLSEAEWEYASRAGRGGVWEAPSVAEHRADPHHAAHAEGDEDLTREVGDLPANAWGLHGMYSALWCWVQDSFEEHYTGVPVDGSALENGKPLRVLRGGTWAFRQQSDPATLRNWLEHDKRDFAYGFRVARRIGPA